MIEFSKNTHIGALSYINEHGVEITEKWVDFIGEVDNYKISSFGRIWSLGRVKIRSNGYSLRIKERILKQSYNQGYAIIRMTCGNGVIMSKRVHRLVAIHFIDNPFTLPEINHKNCIRSDNRFDNLEWCSHKYNNRYAYLLGNKKPCAGEVNGRSKLTENQVLKMRLMKENNPKTTNEELSVVFGISRAVVSRVINRTSWKHI